MKAARPGVTPEDIVAAVLKEFHQSTLPGFYVDYVRNSFRVFLHPEDFAVLKAFQSRIRDEAIRALDQELERINKARGGRMFGTPAKAKRCERLGNWSVEFYTNEDEDASEKGLVVLAEGVPPEELEPLEGSATVKRELPETDESAGRTHRVNDPGPGPGDAQVLATITYTDDAGEHSFEMVKDLVKIGRGGPNVWVDVTVASSKDVSRLHCQIRWDSGTEKFFIRDFSRYGTWVQGKRVPPSVAESGIDQQNAGLESALPPQAQILLAEKVTLQFRAAKKGKRFWPL